MLVSFPMLIGETVLMSISILVFYLFASACADDSMKFKPLDLRWVNKRGLVHLAAGLAGVNILSVWIPLMLSPAEKMWHLYILFPALGATHFWGGSNFLAGARQRKAYADSIRAAKKT